MLGIEEYKKALGFDAEGLSEEEIIEAREIQDGLAEAFFPLWLETIKKKDTPIISPLINEKEIYKTK
jgi:hypothetical protein